MSTRINVNGVDLNVVAAVCQRVMILGKIVDRESGASLLNVMGVTFIFSTYDQYAEAPKLTNTKPKREPDWTWQGNSPLMTHRTLSGTGWVIKFVAETGPTGHQPAKWNPNPPPPEANQFAWGQERLYTCKKMSFEGDAALFAKDMLYAQMAGLLPDDNWDHIT